MALIIKTPKGIYDTPTDFEMEVEITSPIYTDKGSQTIAATLPGTKHNLSIVDHINRLDIANAPAKDVQAVIADGIYRRIGKQNITSASVESGIVSNIGFDESLMYEAWNNISLKKLPGLPIYKPSGGITALTEHLNNVMKYNLPADYYVFPIQVKNDSADDVAYPEFINPIQKIGNAYELKKNARTEKMVISGSVADVKLPAGYGISPFIRVSKILQLIFSAYGFELIENPFERDYQLKKMVVLNNVADATVAGQINYKDLMPDCTINDFLEAIFCRTGARIFVNGDNRTARIKLLKDTFSSSPFADWSQLKAADPVPNYEQPKQIRLSASTSFDEAYTDAESFEEFLDKYKGIITEVENTPPEYVPDNTYICYQASTGRFYKRNIASQNVSLLSSDFFAWDKKTANVEYEEISSSDECLPMTFCNNLLVPQYMAGTVNLNTTLRGAKVNEQKTDTPLCFCFAMGMATDEKNVPLGYYYGSSLCRTPAGNYFRDNDGNTFKYSQVFRGEDGAFNQFFKEWDAILRHANHTLKSKINLDRIALTQIDTSRPILLSGQKLMIESAKHTVPYQVNKPAEVNLRTTKLLKPFDLEQEQGIVKMIPQTTKWVIVSYADNAFAATAAQVKSQLEKRYDLRGFNVLDRKILTQPSGDDFSSYLPPTKEEVLGKKEILDTYDAELQYWFSFYVDNPEGANTDSIDSIRLQYEAGIKAVTM
jgi:hypothetical protein